VEGQVYWQLSDALLWELFTTTTLDTLPPNFHFLDAGGGTGRWSSKILKHYHGAHGVIRDISEHMLGEARKKQAVLGKDRLQLVNAPIDVMPEFANATFDVVFNFHNVIGFLESPSDALREMTRVLKPGGHLVTVAPSQLHMAFFNIFLGNLGEAETCLQQGKGRFTKEMPAISVFRVEQLRQWYEESGLTQIVTHGFPVLIYPGYQETQLAGSSSKITEILSSPEHYKRVLEMERRVLFNEDGAARGNNLYVRGIKSAKN
jgi:ubiquinone/menaquinone biosynthesis C-methylase UbiE